MGICIIENCNNEARSKGLCHKHYSQWRYQNIPGIKEKCAIRNKQLYLDGKTWNKKNPELAREYTRKWQYKKYHTDENWRKMMIKANSKPRGDKL